MIVNRESLHYKVRGWIFNDDYNKSLCVYFWQVVFSPLICVFVGLALICALPFILADYLRRTIPSKYNPDLGDWFDGSFLGLLSEFMLAKYRKICPLIKFK